MINTGRHFLDENRGCATLDRLRDVLMAVEIAAAEGGEEIAWLHIARIDGDAGYFGFID